MPAVQLVPIDAHNWREAAQLTVAPDQADFIEPNIWSIAESRFYDQLHAYAIRSRGRTVGFLMWGESPDDGRPWLFRFMIDQAHQRQGLGLAALHALLTQLRRFGVPELNVGYHRDNVAAERLYLKAGFQKTGIAPWGELMARIDLGYSASTM